MLEDLPIISKKILQKISSFWNDESCPIIQKQESRDVTLDLDLTEKVSGPELNSIPEEKDESMQSSDAHPRNKTKIQREKKGNCRNRSRSRLLPRALKFLLTGFLVLQRLVPAAATDENSTLVLSIQQDTIVYGQTLVIECKIEEKCMVTSWSVGKTSDNYDTVLRRNKTFDDSMKYGGNVVTKDNLTIYQLIIKSVNKLDEQYVYRCECGDLFKAGTLTAINEKLRFVTVVNPPKRDQDSPKTIDDWVIAVIVIGLLLVLIIVGIAGVRWYLKQRMTKYQQANSSPATSSSVTESVDTETDDIQLHG